ncbi:MAG: sulfur carrier protein ThiS adenylyltransferase ThiF [Coriobacteriia bacterium]|nr:sulfur carrier protein ThiS adenylyltransferase ThiF [Coriobacteriia bacterium]
MSAEQPHPDTELRARLAKAEVAIIGCGGLGSNVAAMLLRSGVRTLTLVDFDTVAKDNLNRQLFFRDQIGMPKTEALADTLLRIDPEAELRLVDRCISSADLVEVIGDADVIAEAVDGAPTKAMILEVCTRDLPDVPIITVSGLAGYDSANLIVTEKLAVNLYVVGDLESDIRSGLSLLASRVMVAAAHQAHAIIRVLLDCEDI